MNTLLHATGMLHGRLLGVKTGGLRGVKITVWLNEGEVVHAVAEMLENKTLLKILQTTLRLILVVVGGIFGVTITALTDFDKEVLVLGAWLVVDLLVGVLLV